MFWFLKTFNFSVVLSLTSLFAVYLILNNIVSILIDFYDYLRKKKIQSVGKSHCAMNLVTLVVRDRV